MEFVCHVGTADGQVQRQARTAPDERALRSELEREGLHLLGIERARAGALRPAWLGRRQRKVPLPLLQVFNQELAALLKAGLPLLQALQMLSTRQRDPHFRATLEQVRERVKSGVELSEAFGEFGDVFPPLYASSLKAGERTGELEQVLRRFIRYLRLMIDARKKVVSALVYPAFLIAMSLAMIAGMTLYVLPKFQTFYASMEIGELNPLTRFTLGLSGFLRANILIIVVAVAVAAFLFGRWRATPSGRREIDRLRLRIPLIGPVLRLFSVSEYCRSLATLLSGGMPLVPALEISTRAVGNSWVRMRLEPSIPRVREGRSLHQSLEETGIVPELAVDMVEVGETTGSLDSMLSSVSEFFDEEVETRLQRMLSLLEPVLLVTMAVFVGLLLFSVYLPIIQALSKIQ